MKKKLLLILLSVTMVATMMPLSVFAGTQNAQVRTDLGNTGLYLLGDRPALPGDQGDYIVGKNDVQILTKGWTLGGQNEHALIQSRTKATEPFEIAFEDGLEISGLISNAQNSNIKINGDVVIATAFWTLGVNVTGTGTINVEDGSLYVAPGGNGYGCPFTLDGPTVKVNNITGGGFGQLGTAGTFGDNLTIKSGKFIAENYTRDGDDKSHGIICVGDINVSENGELFVSGLDDSILWGGDFSSAASSTKGSAEAVPYEEKESVSSDLIQTTTESPMGECNTFAIDETNETLAKTVCSSTGEEPTTTHKVTFMVDDTEYTSQEVADGYCAKMPIDPVEDGYKFTGWYYDKEATEIFDFDTPITSDLTLYAGWEKAAPTPDNPQSGGNAKTGDNTMPIVFIALGFAAAVTGYVAYRKLRNR